MRRRLLVVVLSTLLLARTGPCSPTHPDFSGTWKQSNERSTPKRAGNVILHIEHHDPAINVETTAQCSSGLTRHAVQRYTTNGKVSISTGADGDEFHTSIVWDGNSLVFSVEEREDGRIILSKETWTLIEDSSVLERVREVITHSPDGAGRQRLLYVREAPPT